MLSGRKIQLTRKRAPAQGRVSDHFRNYPLINQRYREKEREKERASLEGHRGARAELTGANLSIGSASANRNFGADWQHLREKPYSVNPLSLSLSFRGREREGKKDISPSVVDAPALYPATGAHAGLRSIFVRLDFCSATQSSNK